MSALVGLESGLRLETGVGVVDFGVDKETPITDLGSGSFFTGVSCFTSCSIGSLFSTLMTEVLSSSVIFSF
ncbi:hypothetical protein HanRHA438_Chr17g0803851 [Helianthus annuus]|nr:hypothetical protein HanIR_Chr17g0861071 [Helianthus annuus]KAJ0825497.1 hypothetical protein HanRHA438_Chr17g0803851 [Helianthus annuus]